MFAGACNGAIFAGFCRCISFVEMKKKMAFALKRKVVFTTIVGILAISAIYFSVGRAFERISVNIDRLAEPNERLLQEIGRASCRERV